MKLDKLSRRIIQELKSHNNGTSVTCSLYSTMNASADISIDDFSKLLGISADDLRAAVRYMVGKGLLEHHTLHNGMEAGFKLSHVGLHNPEIKRIERRQFFFRSIWVPILVSAATTIVIFLLQRLLPLILEWLTNTP